MSNSQYHALSGHSSGTGLGGGRAAAGAGGAAGAGAGVRNNSQAEMVGRHKYAHLDHEAMGGDHAEADVDVGFPPEVRGFDRGVLDYRTPDDSALLRQQPMPSGAACCSTVGVLLATASVIGWPYLIAKTHLVRKGEVALAEWNSGHIRVLTPGWHLLECVNTSVARFRVTNDVIRHGAMKIIRVRPGFVGLGTQNGSPVFLQPGRHVIMDPLFQFTKSMSLTEQHIQVGTSHIITIPPGFVGLCRVNGKPHFLEPGKHRINHPNFDMVQVVSSTNEHIQCGSKHRIIVHAGAVGLAFDNGRAVLLEAGRVYNIDSATFKFIGSRSVNKEVITHGSITIVTVRSGKHGISFDDGRLVVLPEGRHILDKATHMFGGFLPAGQQTLRIPNITCMSSDNIGLKFDSALTIIVVDAKKAVLMLGGGVDFNLHVFHRTIVEKAQLALSIIIGNSRFHHGFQASTMTTTNDAEEAKGNANLDVSSQGGSNTDIGGFRHAIHDRFMAGFKKQMLESCGVSVIDMSIEDIALTNTDLQRAMARGALARTELDQAQVDVQVQRTKAESRRAAELVVAEGDAQAVRIRMAADSESAALAETKMAQGKARAILLIADAEAERVRKLNAALSEASEITKDRELILASGRALEGAKATLMLGNNMQDVTRSLSQAAGGQ